MAAVSWPFDDAYRSGVITLVNVSATARVACLPMGLHLYPYFVAPWISSTPLNNILGRGFGCYLGETGFFFVDFGRFLFLYEFLAR